MNNELIIKTDVLKISCTVQGLLKNNIYLIESDGHACLIDPSCNEGKIVEFIGDANIDTILLTHYHFDHIGAASYIKQKYNSCVYASKIDAPFIEGTKQLPVMHRRVKNCKCDTLLENNDEITIGKITLKVIETPGHSLGSVCFYCEDTGLEKNTNKNIPVLFSGDTLFFSSCGRVDFEDSRPDLMEKSLNKLAKLPSDTLVLPGHGQMTTILHERNYMLKDR